MVKICLGNSQSLSIFMSHHNLVFGLQRRARGEAKGGVGVAGGKVGAGGEGKGEGWGGSRKGGVEE